jgi:hypothetical protein
MNSLPVGTTLAVFTMASAASIAPVNPFVSIRPSFQRHCRLPLQIEAT